MGHVDEKRRKDTEEAKAYLTRHCFTPNGVILVDAEDGRGVFTTFEGAMAFARSRTGACDLSAHVLDDPEFVELPSIKTH